MRSEIVSIVPTQADDMRDCTPGPARGGVGGIDDDGTALGLLLGMGTDSPCCRRRGGGLVAMVRR
jgi:hypothetical protein